MAVVYSILCSLVISLLILPATKVYQLENYKIKKTLKKIISFDLANGDKNKLKFTNRIKRFLFCVFLVFFLIFLIIFSIKIKIYLKIILILLTVVFLPIFFLLAHLLDLPIEESIKRSYIRKAKKKLNALKCKKIAITGSFGKTTTKNFLFQILSKKFKVCITPKSYNTPMGVCMTILDKLAEDDDFFVVEMGARQRGDIDYLCKMVGVDYGIITAVGNCHIETFKTLEAVENTKAELCDNTNNFVVINGSNKSGIKIYERCKKKKYLVCKENSFAYVQDVKIKDNKTYFNLFIDNKMVKTHTNLLGKGNIDNITTAAALCYLLGVSLFDIDNGIRELKPIAHRLEVIRGYCTVIDDSYNSNFDGFCEALEILKSFGGRKILVTPGMVELGKMQYEQNYKIGEQIASCCDIVIVMNKVNNIALTNGIKKGGFEGDIYYAYTRLEQKNLLKEIIKKDDVVLFENDLPDNYR